jgi:hypothetical protein
MESKHSTLDTVSNINTSMELVDAATTVYMFDRGLELLFRSFCRHSNI